MKKCRKLAAAVLALTLAAPCLSPLASEQPKVTRITTEYTDGTRDREEYSYDQNGNVIREYRLSSSDTGIQTEEIQWSETNGDRQISRSVTTVTKPDGQQTVTELWQDGRNPLKKVISSGSYRITEEYGYDEDGNQIRLTRTNEAGTLLYEQTTAYPDEWTVEIGAKDYLGTVLQSTFHMEEDYSFTGNADISRADGTRREFSLSFPSIIALISANLEQLLGETEESGQTDSGGENDSILSGLQIRYSVTGGDGTELSIQISGTKEGDLLYSILTSKGLNLSARASQDGTFTVRNARFGEITGSGFQETDEYGQSATIYTTYSDGTTVETRIETDGGSFSVTETKSNGISAVTEQKELAGADGEEGYRLETVFSNGRSVSLTTEDQDPYSRLCLTYSHGDVSQEIWEKDESFGTVYRYRVLYRDGREEETILLDETEGVFLLIEMMGHMADYSDASWYIQ